MAVFSEEEGEEPDFLLEGCAIVTVITEPVKMEMEEEEYPLCVPAVTDADALDRVHRDAYIAIVYVDNDSFV